MTFRIQHLPRMENFHLRAFTVRNNLTGKIPMREEAEPGCLLKPLPQTFGVSRGPLHTNHAVQALQVSEGIGIDWKNRVIDIDILRDNLSLDSLMFADIALRDKEERTPENLFNAIVGRLGKEEQVLEFNVIKALEKYPFNSDYQNALLVAAANQTTNSDFIRGKFVASVCDVLRSDHLGGFLGQTDPALTRDYFLPIIKKALEVRRGEIRDQAFFLTGFMSYFDESPEIVLRSVGLYGESLVPAASFTSLLGYSAQKLFVRSQGHHLLGAIIGTISKERYPFEENFAEPIAADVIKQRAQFIAEIAGRLYDSQIRTTIPEFLEAAINIASTQNRITHMRDRIEFRRITYAFLGISLDPNIDFLHDPGRD